MNVLRAKATLCNEAEVLINYVLGGQCVEH